MHLNLMCLQNGLIQKKRKKEKNNSQNLHPVLHFISHLNSNPLSFFLFPIRARHGWDTFPSHLHLEQHHFQSAVSSGGEAQAPRPEVVPRLLPGVGGCGCGADPHQWESLLWRWGGASLQGGPPVSGPHGLQGVWACGRQRNREGKEESEIWGQQWQFVQILESRDHLLIGSDWHPFPNGRYQQETLWQKNQTKPEQEQLYSVTWKVHLLFLLSDMKDTNKRITLVKNKTNRCDKTASEMEMNACLILFFLGSFNVNIQKRLNNQTKSCSDSRNVHSRTLWNIKNPSKRQWQIIWQQPEAVWLKLFTVSVINLSSVVSTDCSHPVTPQWRDTDLFHPLPGEKRQITGGRVGKPGPQLHHHSSNDPARPLSGV